MWKAVINFILAMLCCVELALGRMVNSTASVVIGLLGAILFTVLCVCEISRDRLE